MKKCLYVNICIITSQWFLQIIHPLKTLDFITIIPLFAYISTMILIKEPFISRENKIERKSRILLYIMIALSYIVISGFIITSYFNMDVLNFCLKNIFLIIYCALIAIYIKAIFKE